MTEPSALITIGITVTFMFHSFFLFPIIIPGEFFTPVFTDGLSSEFE